MPESDADEPPIRDLGVIQGREVPRAGDDGPSAPASSATGRRTAALQQWLSDLRAARANVPNSRPLPGWVERLAWVLDSVFEVPGTRRRVGIDGVLTFIPVVGDVAGLGLSMVVVAAGIAAGVSVPTVVRMMLNVGLETLVGVVPFAGAVFDLAYKANERNVRLIEADLVDRSATRRSSLKVLAVTVAALFVALALAVACVIATFALTVWMLRWLFGG
ncbi:MAG: DUF4112 domain-containing protein [Actinomycetes bacterium]